jgi:hypothetical protein
MQDLIGLKFKYLGINGATDWTDTIRKVWLRWHLIDRENRIPEIMVTGSIHVFSINQIVIVGKPNHPIEELVLSKREVMNGSNEKDVSVK